MARALRFQYPGAIYHMMARGDGGKVVFENKDNCEVFLSRLGEVCGSCGWRVHAWVLMGNHFHLLLETPQTNLVAGMKWLLGVFSQGWNRTRGRKGHVFQGRCKSAPANGSDTKQFYFRIVAWLEARAVEGGKIGAKAQAAMKRGGYLGEDSFKDQLLDLMEKLKGGARTRPRKGTAESWRDYGERDAENLISLYAPGLGLSTDRDELKSLRKGDERKTLLAGLFWPVKQPLVGVAWAAPGHGTSWIRQPYARSGEIRSRLGRKIG